MTDLEWPGHLDRTPAHHRSSGNRFDVSLNRAIDDLARELENRVEVDDWRLETAADHQKRNPNYPYANANPDDPGAVVKWTKGGEQFAVACDQHQSLRSNIREIGLWLREKRKMEQRPVATADSEFAVARLPPASGEDILADEEPHEVLEVSPDAHSDEINDAYRRLSMQVHSDRGGSREEFERVRRAREVMLDG